MGFSKDIYEDTEDPYPEDGSYPEISYEEEVRERQSKEKKKTTLNNILQRVMKQPALKLVLFLLATAVVLTTIHAVLYLDYYSKGIPMFQEPGEPSFLLKYTGVSALFCFRVAAVAVIYSFLSVQYRRQYKRDENGERRAVVRKPPRSQGRKIVAWFSALAPFLLLPIFIFSIYTCVVDFQSLSDDFWEKDNAAAIKHRLRLFSYLLLVLVPMALLLAAAGTPRGLKRAGRKLDLKNTTVILIALTLILSGLGFFFAYTLSKETLEYNESGGTNFVDEDVGTYYEPLAVLCAAFSVIPAALALSNLDSKKPYRFRINMGSPSFKLVLLGFTLALVSVSIDLTFLNFKDFSLLEGGNGDFMNKYTMWNTLEALFMNLGFFILLGGMLGLMVEHSFQAQVKETNLWLQPGTLWEEMKKKNLVLRNLL